MAENTNFDAEKMPSLEDDMKTLNSFGIDDRMLERVYRAKYPVKSSKKRPDCGIQTDDGDNRKYLSHSLQIAMLDEIDKHDPEQVKKRISEYFTICANNDMKPSVAGLALAFDWSRTQLWRVVNNAEDGGRGYPDSVRIALKKAYNMLAVQMEDYMQNNKIGAVQGIFLMKNMGQGYKDQSDLVVTPSAAIDTNYSADDIRDRYITDGSKDHDN